MDRSGQERRGGTWTKSRPDSADEGVGEGRGTRTRSGGTPSGRWALEPEGKLQLGAKSARLFSFSFFFGFRGCLYLTGLKVPVLKAPESWGKAALDVNVPCVPV